MSAQLDAAASDKAAEFGAKAKNCFEPVCGFVVQPVTAAEAATAPPAPSDFKSFRRGISFSCGAGAPQAE